MQASLTTGNRRAARNVCVSSQEQCLPKHNQQTNKKHIHNVSLCPPMNQERSLQTNTYGRKQDQTQMHQMPKTRFSISIVKTRTLTKTKKNTKRPIENIDKTTNKLYVAAARCQQMKPCITKGRRRKKPLQLDLICCPQQNSDSSYPV